MKCFVFKTIILGDCGVGKTTMLYKYYTGNFNYNNQSTVGVNFVSKYVKNIQCNNSFLFLIKVVKFESFDILFIYTIDIIFW